MTERDDELPGTPDDVSDPVREERVEALLSLTSRAPASLDARIAARRKARDPVLLPVPDAGATSAPQTRGLRRFVLPAILAAAAVIAFLAFRGVAERAGTDGDPGRRSPALAGGDSVVRGGIPRQDSVPAGTPGTPGARDTATRLLPGREDIELGFGRTDRGQPLFSTRIRGFSAAAVDSIVLAARGDATALVAISHPAASQELAVLADRIARAVVARGVAAERVGVRADSAPRGMTGAVTVVVAPPPGGSD